jgi:hypothetical protein
MFVLQVLDSADTQEAQAVKQKSGGQQGLQH